MCCEQCPPLCCGLLRHAGSVLCEELDPLYVVAERRMLPHASQCPGWTEEVLHIFQGTWQVDSSKHRGELCIVSVPSDSSANRRPSL